MSPQRAGRRGFRDRTAAGRALAAELEAYRDRDGVIVLGLARGGVPVAFEVARVLAAPLDVFVVRKLGVPGHEELAMGAIASGGVRVLNREVVAELSVQEEVLDRVIAQEEVELARRERLYRPDRPALEVCGMTAIVVDDGLATGSSMLAAVRALRAREAGSVVVAVPVAPPETCDAIGEEVDHIVCALTPRPFYSVGGYYTDFSQTSDEEVRELLVRTETTAR